MGKANFAVCNNWTQAARFASDSGEAVGWASRQARAPIVQLRGLCKVTAATAISGAANRWKYTVSAWIPPGSSTGITTFNDSWFSSTECRNLREDFNTSTLVDGMDITSPAATVGPVGSKYSGGAWTTTNLEAHVQVWISYDSMGKSYVYFDRPNPIRCS